MLSAVARPLAGSSSALLLRAAAPSFAAAPAASALPAAAPHLFHSSDNRAPGSEAGELGSAVRNGNGNPNDTPLTGDSGGNDDEGQACVITGALNETPCHELATGGLYESFRKDREAMPNPFPSTTTEAFPDPRHSAPLPPGSYPVHSDPSTTSQHPDEAFRSPAQYPTGPVHHSVNLALPDETLELQKQQRKEAEGMQGG